MATHNETSWWMSAEGRLRIGNPQEGAGGALCMACGSVCCADGCGVIAEFRGQRARLGRLPRGLLDELAVHFPGVRWWVEDQPEPARAPRPAVHAEG